MTTQTKTQKVYRGVKYTEVKKQSSSSNEGVYRGVKWSKQETKMKVKAPSGYHWMKQKNGSYNLMKHTGKFVPHKGASLEANFKIQKIHDTKKKKRSQSWDW